MNKHVILLFLFFFSGVSTQLFSQDKPFVEPEANPKVTTEPYVFHLSILPVSEPPYDEGSVPGKVGGPYSILTFKEGSFGKVTEIFSTSGKELKEFANFELMQQKNGYWYGIYHFNDFGKEFVRNDVVPEGLAALEAEVPYLPYRSIYFDMVRNGIVFSDIYEDPFYSLDDVLKNDSEEFEKDMLNKFLVDIRYVSDVMRNDMESPMIQGGRFDGIDLFTAMDMSTVYDVRSFLRYVETKPRLYRGQVWKISETYATWIDAGAPSSSDDLLGVLIDDPDHKSTYMRQINLVDPSILNSWLPDWLDVGHKAQDKGDRSMAKAIFDICYEIAGITESEGNLGWASYYIAGILEDENDFDRSSKSYETAVGHFAKAEDKAGLIAAQNNLGFVYNELQQYTSAQAILEKAYALELQFIADPSESTAITVALTLRHLGNSYLGQKKFKEALGFYEEGLKYVTDDRPASLKRKAAIYFQMAETYKELNKTEDYGFYTQLGVATFREYEDAVKKNKQM